MERKMERKIKNNHNEKFFDPCPIVKKLEGKMKGVFQLQGMCSLLEQFPEFRKTCPSCTFFKDLPPKSYICKRFFCTLDKKE
jgi:hypothetical protein